MAWRDIFFTRPNAGGNTVSLSWTMRQGDGEAVPAFVGRRAAREGWSGRETGQGSGVVDFGAEPGGGRYILGGVDFF
ncbi:hypothetical protein E2562_027581 [Oryza meyeriana var. granulata]|uniref:Uncharacterized protein n=1 Tax=Oryza meyeriana var. granulata TaxID=110450 RepID=A0A6G1DPM9_9ORYZ|nr:hypothetical protein E2562_027581 [Oryza meyeriana var. granulata]